MRWISHERCVRLFELSGGVEAYGLRMLIASQVGIATAFRSSRYIGQNEQSNAKENSKLQQTAYSLECNYRGIRRDLKEDSDLVSEAVSSLENEYDVTVCNGYGSTRISLMSVPCCYSLH